MFVPKVQKIQKGSGLRAIQAVRVMTYLCKGAKVPDRFPTCRRFEECVVFGRLAAPPGETLVPVQVPSQ